MGNQLDESSCLRNMPAVTVDDVLTLPRVPRPDVDLPRAPGRLRDDRAQRFRGRGLPGEARLRRRRPAPARSVRAPRPDGRGRLRPGRAQGHRLASAPRLRDRDLHDRRRDGPPGLQRRRRADLQRRHPVDDRRCRHPAHRDAAGAPRDQRWALPRLPALGQPAGVGQVERAALSGHPWLAGRAAVVRRRRRAGARHRRRARGTRGTRVDIHPDNPRPRDALPGRRADPAVARRTSTHWSTRCPARVPQARPGSRCAAGSSPSSAKGTP